MGDMRRALISAETSRRNKMALLAQYELQDERISWKWQAEPYRSRLMVSFDFGEYVHCLSYDEDIRPKLKGPREP